LQVTVTGRHVAVTDEIKEYATEKVQKLPRFFDRVQAVEVIIDHESTNFTAEMIVTAAGSSRFVAHEKGPEPSALIDLLIDKLERQLTRHKEKVRNRKHVGKPEEFEAPE